MATSDQDSTWKIGDTVQIGDETLTIAGLLKNDPFSENGLTNGRLTLITSDETFVRLTGEEGYSLVLIQTTGDVTDENVQAIQNFVDQTYSFRDKRDERTTGTYMAFVFCVYAFFGNLCTGNGNEYHQQYFHECVCTVETVWRFPVLSALAWDS